MKKAFTMIELVFVIVVIGILAAVIIQNTRTNPLYEAATQLVSHIRYTQHLAMVDDRFDYFNSDSSENSSAHWYKSRWQIIFGSGIKTGNEIAYSIYSDGSSGAGYTGNADVGEMAKDPSDPSKVLSGGSAAFDVTDSRANKKLNLGMSYGVTTDVASLMTGGCSGDTRISFDHLGRTIRGVIKNMTTSYENGTLITSTCNIILTNSDDNVTIAIEPETGYTHILPNS